MKLKLGKKQTEPKPPERPKDLNPPDKPRDFFDYLEVNIISRMKTVNCFNVSVDSNKFTYEKTTYLVKDKSIYLIPDKDGFKIVAFYKEGDIEPLVFKNNNNGIPPRALHLLWDNGLYDVLVTLEGDRTNLIVILVLIANAVIFGLGIYFKYFHTG